MDKHEFPQIEIQILWQEMQTSQRVNQSQNYIKISS